MCVLVASAEPDLTPPEQVEVFGEPDAWMVLATIVKGSGFRLSCVFCGFGSWL